MVRGNTYGGGTGVQKTFGRLLTAICYLEGELCVSDNLEDSRRADEESELSSILNHPTPRRRHCQPRAPFKKPTDCLDGRSINKHHPIAHTQRVDHCA